MAKQTRPRHQSSIWVMFGKIALAALGFAILIAVGAGVATWFVMTPADTPAEKKAGGEGNAFLEFSVSVKADQVRVDGRANFPNGVVLIGTLDKVGSGPVEVKEALVMNRLFALEFGPDLLVNYYLQGPQRALQAGVYRLRVEFDPARQSPFAQESLLRWSSSPASFPLDHPDKGLDPAIIRVSEIFTIGTVEAQRQAQEQEQVYRQMVRQHLNETLAGLVSLMSRLQMHYQEEHAKGSFARTDPRAEEWRIWSAQWRSELAALVEKGQLSEEVSPVSPLLGVRDVLAAAQRQLATLNNLYMEVLTNERVSSDRDLQRTERTIQQAYATASAQLGHPIPGFPARKVEEAKSTVVITAPVVNVRSRPGMIHEAIAQAKKDAVFDFIGEQGEWFQIQLSDERTGWVHRNVASKEGPSGGMAEGIKRQDPSVIAAEQKPLPQLDPINLLATPVTYIPQPTPDEQRIYGEIEAKLRDIQARSGEERRMMEQRILQHIADMVGISTEQAWNAYLKVQGWEVMQ